MNIIYCFSGTGNSLYVAKKVSEILGDCEVVLMKKGISTELANDYERIGFVFPVYAFGLPNFVADFVNRLNLQQSQTYFFAINTNGGFTANAMPQIAKLLADKRQKLNYGNSICMVGNSITHYNLSKRADTKLAKAEKLISTVASDILAKKDNKVKKFNRFFAWGHNNAMLQAHDSDLGFNINEKCTGCGICQKLCPVENIVIQNGKPKFQHGCESCVSCLQLCPQQAINFKNKTQSRTRYRHPKISVQELFKN